MTDLDDRPAGVLVVGDANPDLILRGDVVPRFGQAEQVLDDAALVLGGSAAITAHGLARLGRPVSLLAAVGDDAFGRGLTAELAAAGVDTGAIAVRTGVGTGISVVLSRPDDRAILTMPGAIATLCAQEVRTAVRSPDAAGVTHAHFSSLFLQPLVAGQLAELLAELRGRGLTTSLDTNADPAQRWQGVAPLLAHLDLLLPNRTEVSALAEDPDPMSAAAKLAQHGPVVVVKNGALGAFAVVAGGEVLRAAAEPGPVVDTTGAGDTFNAAFLDAWLDGRDIGSCLNRAVRAGSISVSAAGGTAGQPRRRDLDPDRKDQ